MGLWVLYLKSKVSSATRAYLPILGRQPRAMVTVFTFRESLGKSCPKMKKSFLCLGLEFLFGCLCFLERALSDKIRKIFLNYVCIFIYWLIYIIRFLGKKLIELFLMTFSTSLLLFYPPSTIPSPSVFSSLLPFIPFPQSDHLFPAMTLSSVCPFPYPSNGPFLLS